MEEVNGEKRYMTLTIMRGALAKEEKFKKCIWTSSNPMRGGSCWECRRCGDRAKEEKKRDCRDCDGRSMYPGECTCEIKLVCEKCGIAVV